MRMSHWAGWTCLLLAFGSAVLGQEDVPIFKAEVTNTFIWGEDGTTGAVSSTSKEPLTGNEIRRLKHNGVEVNSRMGFEKFRHEDAAEFILYSTTIINNTESALPVQQGGVAVDGHLVSPLALEPSRKVKKKPGKQGGDTIGVQNLHCFSAGYLPAESASVGDQYSSTFVVQPKSSIVVSGVIRDPRHDPMFCSADGCYPKGMIRYSIRAGGHEYIFTWQGHLLANCGP